MKFNGLLAASLTIVIQLTIGVDAMGSDFFGDKSNLRQVKAAHKESELLSRDNSVHPRYSVDMTFAEADNHVQRKPVFAATVHVQSRKPTLYIEEFEHLLSSVKCTPSGTGTRIQLAFKDGGAYESARRTLSGLHGGMLITSHEGCNDEGERKPYMVDQLQLSDASNNVDFGTHRKTWKDGFKKYTFSYGHSEEPHTLRRFRTVTRRDDQNATQTEDVDDLLPDNAPTETALSLDLGYQSTDNSKDFDFPMGPDVPIKAGCENCSTWGTLEMTHGTFDIDIDWDIFDWGDDDDEGSSNNTMGKFIKNGFVDIQLKNFGALAQLHTTPDGGHAFSYELITLPKLSPIGFDIYGIGQAGLLFQPVLAASFNIEAPIKFLYGFKIKMPEVASVRLDFSDWSHSSQTGFDEADIESLPFQTVSNPPEIDFYASLRPRFPLGFSFFDEKLTAEVALFVDLPQLELSLSNVQSADANCKPLPDTKLDSMEKLQKSLFKGNLTRISNTVNMNMGVDAVLAIPGLDIGPFHEITSAATLLQTKYPIASACLSWDGDNTRLVPASQVLASATAKPKPDPDSDPKSDDHKKPGKNAENSKHSKNSKGHKNSKGSKGPKKPKHSKAPHDPKGAKDPHQPRESPKHANHRNEQRSAGPTTSYHSSTTVIQQIKPTSEGAAPSGARPPLVTEGPGSTLQNSLIGAVLFITGLVVAL